MDSKAPAIQRSSDSATCAVSAFRRSMKVAFATEDGQHVNAHFGWAKKIAIYDINPDDCRFVNCFEFIGNLEEDGNEDKLAPKLEAIKDCAILYVAAIGGSAAARVVAKNIHPIKVAETQAIDDSLDRK